MSNQLKLVLNSGEIKKYLKSSSVQGALTKEAERIAQAAGEGYGSSVKVGRTRALANVHAETYKARLDNSKNATILKNAR
ncbi:hypothetical protein [Rothia sp. P5766]|uniref:hypothetical protein n=1 Tax=unclassified Rothia (in: high G+C Gram-positive bacteria) TaxID=2689056 RepID=UPI003AE323C8